MIVAETRRRDEEEIAPVQRPRIGLRVVSEKAVRINVTERAESEQREREKREGKEKRGKKRKGEKKNIKDLLDCFDQGHLT